MNVSILLSTAEQGLIYSLVALGLYVSFRTLDIADLTTDGSFTLGIVTCTALTAAGHPVLAFFGALAAGAAAGFVTALLQTKLGVQPILAGIITMTALVSVNLMVLGGKSNQTLLRTETLFTRAQTLLGDLGGLALAGAAALLCGGLLVLFLRTQLGLSLRATGDNRAMVAASSINPAFTTTVGLCLANAVIALSGALLAQQQGYGDTTLGTGMVVIGLASLVIGEVLTGRRGGVAGGVAACVLGSVVYRIITALALTSRLGAVNLKLVSAVIVAAAISYPAVAEKIKLAQKRRKAGRHA